MFFKVNSLGFEKKVSDAVNVVPVSQGRTSESAKQTVNGASESTVKVDDYVEDVKGGKHMSTLVQPTITAASVIPTKSTANLFDDDDVDDSQLFTHTTTTTTSGSHPLGVVGRVTSIVRSGEVKRADDLFGDGADDDDVVRRPAVQRQHSNVFDNDGFAAGV